MLSARWHTGRFLIQLLFAAILFAYLFSMMLPPSASWLAPTSTATDTPVPTLTFVPIVSSTITLTPMTDPLVTPNADTIPWYTVYFQRDLWQNLIGSATGVEDFEQEPFGGTELSLPYITRNRFILRGTSAAQILRAPELLDSGNLIHFRDVEQGMIITFPDNAFIAAFGFDYTSSEDWVLTFNQFQMPLAVGDNQFIGVIMQQIYVTEFNLSGLPGAQQGIAVDNITYLAVSPVFVPSTSTATAESGTP